MTDKQAFEMILNGANFTLEYGNNHFYGNIQDFKNQCKNVVDYFHKTNNFFNLWLMIDYKYEYTIDRNVKSKIKKMLTI